MEGSRREGTRCAGGGGESDDGGPVSAVSRSFDDLRGGHRAARAPEFASLMERDVVGIEWIAIGHSIEAAQRRLRRRGPAKTAKSLLCGP